MPKRTLVCLPASALAWRRCRYPCNACRTRVRPGGREGCSRISKQAALLLGTACSAQSPSQHDAPCGAAPGRAALHAHETASNDPTIQATVPCMIGPFSRIVQQEGAVRRTRDASAPVIPISPVETFDTDGGRGHWAVVCAAQRCGRASRGPLNPVLFTREKGGKQRAASRGARADIP